MTSTTLDTRILPKIYGWFSDWIKIVSRCPIKQFLNAKIHCVIFFVKLNDLASDKVKKTVFIVLGVFMLVCILMKLVDRFKLAVRYFNIIISREFVDKSSWDDTKVLMKEVNEIICKKSFFYICQLFDTFFSFFMLSCFTLISKEKKLPGQ